jgi:glycosyltransferase involved in cell wall biosynthesis
MVPCLNEAENLPKVLASLPKCIDGCNADTLVVDDGSTDDSAKVAKDSGAVVISHGVNYGVGRAFQTALAFAIKQRYDIMVTIDADGQFPVSDIPKLVGPILDRSASFVSANRFADKGRIEHMSAVKRWGNTRMTSLVNRLTGKKFFDVSCGFRAYSRDAMLRLNLMGQFTYTQEVFLNLAFREMPIREIPIKVEYFPDRKSRVVGSISRYALNTFKIILRTYRDYFPLKFFVGIGLGFLVPGLSLLLFLLGWYLHAGRFTPHIWSGFVGGGFVLAAAVCFILGLLADMMVRLRNNQEEILYLLRRDQVD